MGRLVLGLVLDFAMIAWGVLLLSYVTSGLPLYFLALGVCFIARGASDKHA